jgi:hypothetical protein
MAEQYQNGKLYNSNHKINSSITVVLNLIKYMIMFSCNQIAGAKAQGMELNLTKTVTIGFFYLFCSLVPLAHYRKQSRQISMSVIISKSIRYYPYVFPNLSQPDNLIPPHKSMHFLRSNSNKSSRTRGQVRSRTVADLPAFFLAAVPLRFAGTRPSTT